MKFSFLPTVGYTENVRFKLQLSHAVTGQRKNNINVKISDMHIADTGLWRLSGVIPELFQNCNLLEITRNGCFEVLDHAGLTPLPNNVQAVSDDTTKFTKTHCRLVSKLYYCVFCNGVTCSIPGNAENNMLEWLCVRVLARNSQKLNKEKRIVYVSCICFCSSSIILS